MNSKLRAVGLFLTPFLMVSYSGLVAKAGVDPAIHKLCSDVKDYSGCVRIQSGEIQGVTRIITQEGASISEGNACPDAYAYIGNGYCQRVYCNTKGVRLFAQGHDRRLGGKGWSCTARWDSGGGSLRFENSTSVRATFIKICPTEEPEIGRNNSCQNGKEESLIENSEPPLGMGGRITSNL